MQVVPNVSMFNIFFINGIFKTQKLKSSLEANSLINSCNQIFMTLFLLSENKNKVPDTYFQVSLIICKN